MNSTIARRILVSSFFATLLTLAAPIAHADHWTTPTPEELKMTSQPEAPGAPAVYLYREETTEDRLHRFTIYVRLKVLTEGGKEYGNVELEYAHNNDGGSVSVENIEGRTIHPDGTIIPFTGKPYDKLIEKNKGVRVMAKVFSLPDVEVGSIIEYRYSRYLDDHYFMAPQWYIQSKLFTRKAHYLWKPTGETLISNDDRGQLTNTIAWTPILPPNTQVKQVETPAGGPNGSPQVTIEVDVHDIPPAPEEEYMPPVTSFTYRVLFYYSPYRTAAEFWKNEGKHWSKLQDKFIGPGPGVGAAVQQLTASSDTQDQKLRKLYAAIMQLENTDFTREHSTTEDKSLGLGKLQTTDDILARKRGSSNQLAELFVAMARAAGMKAYVAALTDRDHSVFNPNYLTLSQLDDYIAIVNVDGKEQYFDPGSRYCPYQHLAWKHTVAGGIRQTDKGTDIVGTPFESYTFSRIQRVADLKMDEQGIVTGSVKMTYMGSPALLWRHRSLTGDSTSLEEQLKTDLEKLLPAGMDVKVGDIQRLTDYEQPLVVNYTIKGPIAASAGKRILLSSDIFETNSKPTFPHEKRDLSVYFEYTKTVQDAVRITFPPTLAVESLPATAQFNFHQAAAYALNSQSTPTSFTFHRELAVGDIIFKPEDYAGLRSFYGQFENKDQESVVLTAASPTTAAKSGSPAN